MKPKSIEEILKLTSTQAAPSLLGCILSRQTLDGELALKIVETEAYHQNDPASHPYHGMTLRTAPMFEPGGRIYVYFTYGMHYCLNIVVGQKGVGEAVLLRAGEPITGVEIMKKLRNTDKIHNIASGPAKLTQALGIISTQLSGKKLGPKTLLLFSPEEQLQSKDIIISPRIGIKHAIDEPWRFYIKGNTFVSRV